MSRSRLLIDVSAGFNQGAGIGRYAREILAAALPELAEDFELRLWYASSSGRKAAFAEEALRTVPLEMQKSIKRSKFSRRRIDQLARLPIEVPTRLLAGGSDLAYSPDFTLPGDFGGKGMVTVHDLAFEIIPTAYPAGLLSYLRQVVPKSIRRASKVAVVSRTTRIDVVERYNIPAERVVVIPNATDDRFYDAKSLSPERKNALGVPEDYLLTVGTIEPRKNYATLLIAQRLAFESTKRPLIIVGRSGWQNRAEMATIAELAETGAVIPLLNADDADLPGLYAGATGMVYVPLYEGFGLPVLEAMAAGVTVITSDIPSVREVAAEFATVVPPSDVEAIAHALIMVQAATEQERGARRAAARQYTWGTSSTILVSALKELGEPD